MDGSTSHFPSVDFDSETNGRYTTIVIAAPEDTRFIRDALPNVRIPDGYELISVKVNDVGRLEVVIAPIIQIVTKQYFANSNGLDAINIPAGIFEFESGSTVIVHPLTPELAGYEFLHWEVVRISGLMSYSVEVLLPGEGFILEADVHLYAQWQPVVDEGAGNGNNNNSNDDTKVYLPIATPPNTGVANQILLYGTAVLIAAGTLILLRKKSTNKK
jgi:LPXTG-motif cell wall-anchored protein